MKTSKYSVGYKIGKLAILRKIPPQSKGKHSKWLCRCECGNEIVVDNSNLRTQRQCKLCAIENAKTHGMSNTALYTVWEHMKRRCLNEKDESFFNYGGRGIGVYDEWLDFETFMDWALRNGYSSELTLDRIDNNGDYCPENCRWVTRKSAIQQSKKQYLHNGVWKNTTVRRMGENYRHSQKHHKRETENRMERRKSRFRSSKARWITSIKKQY